MMRMKTKITGISSINANSAGSGGGRRDSAAGGGDREAEREKEWELRPGGMLVQKRDPDSDQHRLPPPPTIRVRVKYGSIYHEINISSQASFGELKKMLSGPTGLHHLDQKILFKDKERDSKAFLDAAGVKDRAKMVVVEDPISQEKRYIEMRKTAKMEKASKSVADISLEVDRLAGQVSALESVISRGGKIAEKTVMNLIELLMNQLIRLDEIVAEGDVKLQRKMQVTRVQKYVETLDVLKIKNSMSSTNGSDLIKQEHQQQRYPNGQTPPSLIDQHQRNPSGEQHKSSPIQTQPLHLKTPPSAAVANSAGTGTVVITRQWETFDSGPPAILPAPPTMMSKNISTTNNNNNNPPAAVHPMFSWDLL